MHKIIKILYKKTNKKHSEKQAVQNMPLGT